MQSAVCKRLTILISLAMFVLTIAPLPAFAASSAQPTLARPSSCGSSSSTAIAQSMVASQDSTTTDQALSTIVTGGGNGMVRDPSELTFPFWYGLAGIITTNNLAKGQLHVLFGEEFGQVWGALPGVTSIQLTGSISSGSVSTDGTVVVAGTLTESDYIHGQGEVFREENIPFQIVSGGDIGTHAFSLQWCELPTFWASVPHGGLHIHTKQS